MGDSGLRLEGAACSPLLFSPLRPLLFRGASHSNVRVSDWRAHIDAAKHDLPQSDRHFANFDDLSEVPVAPAAQQVSGVRENELLLGLIRGTDGGEEMTGKCRIIPSCSFGDVPYNCSRWSEGALRSAPGSCASALAER